MAKDLLRRPRTSCYRVLRGALLLTVLTALCFTLTDFWPWDDAIGASVRDSGDVTSGRLYLIGRNPNDLASFNPNSRALAVLGPVCFTGRFGHQLTTYTHGEITCHEVAPSLPAQPPPRYLATDSQCTNFLETALSVYVMPASLTNPNRIQFPARVPTKRLHALQNVTWINETTLVLPNYPYLYNIYHFARAFLFALHVMWHPDLYDLPSPPTTLLQLYRPHYSWPIDFIAAIRAALPALNITSLTDLHTRPHPLCLSRAVLLGTEGAVDAFHFLNDSDIYTRSDFANDSHLPALPRDAVRFRSVLARAGVAGGEDVVREEAAVVGVGVGGEVDLMAPPRSVVFVVREGHKRTFLHNSKLNFLAVLREVTQQHGVPFCVENFDNKTFAEQVRIVQRHGLVVGIHGANLVNTMFMRPGSALFEVFPFKYKRAFYVAGGNAGLRYSYWECRSGDDFHCRDAACALRNRDRYIHLEPVDLVGIREHVEVAVKYLKRVSQQSKVTWVRDGPETLRIKGAARSLDGA